MADQRIAAWDAVFKTLLQVKPDFLDSDKPAIQAACDAIRGLAAQAQQPAAAVPDRSAIDDAIWRVLDRHNCNGSDRRLRVELIEAVFSVMAAADKENNNG